MGSVRIPAAYCGLFGFMASHSALSLEGIVPLAPTLDAVGPLARTGADAATLAACLLGQALPPARSLKGLRVGLLPQVDAVQMEPEVALESVANLAICELERPISLSLLQALQHLTAAEWLRTLIYSYHNSTSTYPLSPQLSHG
jgi:aspartyl-tRNA(Asn)/glutamyl-tRNA(Gln) amidotransferase subunit A